jgi:hypothetical protein
MRSLQIWALALVPLFLFLSPPEAGAQAGGSIGGQVVNGTAGGATIGPGIVVKAHVMRADVEVETLETWTEESGRFRFEGLDPDGSLEYWLEAAYLGVTYPGAAPYQFADAQEEIEATVTVYETTGDDSVIRLGAVHLIAESFGQVLRISEIHFFSNSGDRTYVGQASGTAPSGTVFIPLPENGVGLAFGQDGSPDRFLEVEGGLLDREPVLPGEQTSLVLFSYHLIVNDAILPLERRFAYPISDFSILAAQPGLEVRSSQLESGGIQEFQGRRYAFYVAQGLPANEPLTLQLLPLEIEAGQGLSGGTDTGSQITAAAPPGNQRLLRGLGLALAAMLVAAAAIYPIVTAQQDSGKTRRPDLMSSAQVRALVSDLAALEDAFGAGDIDEASYKQQRAAKHRALRALSR